MTCTTYTPPDLCLGNYTLQNPETLKADNSTLASYAAEHIEIGGAVINCFLLRGVHEQGLLMDLTGAGTPLSSGALAGTDVTNAFNISGLGWSSALTGYDIITTPAYIGYYFGTKKGFTGLDKYDPPVNIVQHITTLKLQQGPNTQNRVTQARVERADGSISANMSFTGVGNGQLIKLRPGYSSRPSTIYVVANSASTFTVTSSISGFAGTYQIGGEDFGSQDVLFAIEPGSTSFVAGDAFIIDLTLNWLRADVVNLPDTPNLETISVQPSSPAPYWRIVPIIFNGGNTDSWEVIKLEMIDYQATQLDNIQDPLFLENRDRDYSTTSIALKCAYQPLESIGDMSKFGFSLMDQYAFTCSFARMVQLLGRPIIIGDIIEVTPEVQYDAQLRPVKRFLEVTDCSWAAEGYTPAWTPLLYRFLANQVLPSQETKDIFGTPEQQMYTLDDSDFLCGISQHQASPINVSNTIKAEVLDAVPETGQTTDGIASGMPIVPTPQSVLGAGRGQSDQQDMYIEDGMPPDGKPYTEGYVLPDINLATDGEYFRLNYASELNVPPRLFRFSLLKHRWIYLETDLRSSYSSMKPSLRNALISMNSKPLNSL